MELNIEEKRILLTTARRAIESLFEERDRPEIDFEKHPIFQSKSGAFVTLHKHDDLRGCIGFITAEAPLIETIWEAAKLAASNDPRFPQVGEDELEEIDLEVSVLSPPEAVESYDDIEIGKHGLIVNEDYASGLLLPQVATDHNMDREEFLSAVCGKAGLPSDYWQKNDMNLLSFTATVFSEEDEELR